MERQTEQDESKHTCSRPALQVDADFPGGNIRVDTVDGDDIYVHQDLRDTRGDWFYWHFRVRGAAGRCLRVHFTRSNVIGVLGPAVSTDGGVGWDWLGADAISDQSFVCSVPADTDDIRFCFCIPYVEADLHDYLATWAGSKHLRVETLCTTPAGRQVERLHVGRLDGSAQQLVALTCRHHACETTASYALEGIIATVLSDTDEGRWLRQRVEMLAIPFVDKDGVEDGDQGKNRVPRDHNRDYAGAAIHSSTRAVREYLAQWSQGKLRVALDLHCPHIRGKMNECIYFVGVPDACVWHEVTRLSRIVEQTPGGALPYHESDNLPFGMGWNSPSSFASGRSFAVWAGELPEVRCSSTLEIPYASVRGWAVTAERARAFGRRLARALCTYLQQD